MNRAFLLLIAGHACLLFAKGADAWGNDETHPLLADAAYRRLEIDPAFDAYLRQNIGLEDGHRTKLALTRGFNVVLEDLLDELRFRHDLNALPHPLGFAPGDVVVEFNSPTTARDAKTDYRVERLIRLGTFAEDVPNPRARHHFHDPEKLHEPPRGNRGLDNQGMIPLIDILLAESFTTFRGGNPLRVIGGILAAPFEAIPGRDLDYGNFDGTGRSALDRALNLPTDGDFPSDEAPANHFALPDAERYLFRGMTAPSEEEREHYLALYFIAFGHALHLLQDMGVAAHVRNDFVVDHVLGGASLEAAADTTSSLALARALQSETESLTQSRPRAFLEQHNQNPQPANPVVDLSRYDTGMPNLQPAAFDVGDFWGKRPRVQEEETPTQ